MKTVIDPDGNPRWTFNGIYVLGINSEYIYRIEEDEVFSVPQTDGHFPSGRAPAILIGTISDGIAIGEDNSILFTF